MSLRAIARKLEIDRKTVSKVVHAYEDAIATDPEGGLNRVFREEPRYKPRDYTPRVLLKPVTDEIDKWLKENDKRRSSGMRKQCLKRQDIHRQLIEKGFDVSYSSVCKYIARRKAERGGKSKDVFIKIHREPGQECEFDWGEVKLRIRGVVTVFTMAVFAFPYSKGRRAYLFRHQDALAFMESHRNFFRDVNGVPYHMVYDNMKVAVAFTDEAFMSEARGMVGEVGRCATQTLGLPKLVPEDLAEADDVMILIHGKRSQHIVAKASSIIRHGKTGWISFMVQI